MIWLEFDGLLEEELAYVIVRGIISGDLKAVIVDHLFSANR
jgi:hypothetical protein